MASKADEKRNASYNRTQVRRKMEETIGSASVTYYLDEAETVGFDVERPMFRTEATKKRIADLADDADDTDLAKAVLGDQYEAFKAAGGVDDEIGLLLTNLQLEQQDSLKNGRPTQR
jgi:hypothetical protein